MPARARKKRKTIPESTAQDDESMVKQQRRTGKARKKKNYTQESGMETGTSQELDQVSSFIQANVKTPKSVCETSYTQTVPEEPDLSGKCPDCSTSLKPVLDTASNPMPLLQCPKCPSGQLLCEQCLYPCSYSSDINTTTCTNKSCHLVSTLLKCDLVTDPLSRVRGCPQFRACPMCHSLLMHERGCKYISCQMCKHRFCFICLNSRQECEVDLVHYWSLTCSKPRAARQRFQT
ncbi:E3 ubiquitin-protein ligase DDB_G0292642 [Hoplias malabaricus]|uniref:E3 ubiquitin-protein ligase DDB_G0292642 n=1 Tax=Hoplias malabaricus TaxID=27720 RepID=UPI0034631E19